MFDDDDIGTTQLGAVCTCGSGEDFGSCCGSKQDCDCGSEEPAGQCCYTSDNDSESGEYETEEWN